MRNETFNNGKLILNYGTKDAMVIGEVKEATLNKDIKSLVTVTLGSDSIIVNGYMIHEVCQGEYAVYSPEQQKLTGEAAENIDFPTFRYAFHAISYCLGYISKQMIECEEDLKLYLERNVENVK